MKIFRRRLLRTVPSFAITTLAAELAGCGAAPARYYRLAVLPGPIRNTAPQTIRVRNISIPGYLDQNGIAKATGDYEVAVFNNDLWAEPLSEMLQSTLVQNLTQRLPTATVTGSNSAVGAPAGVLVEIEILRFDPVASGRVIFLAQVAIKPAPGGTLPVTTMLRHDAVPAVNDAVNIVASMSSIWAMFADDIAGLIAERTG